MTLKKLKPTLFPAILWFIISFVLLTLPGSAIPKENWLDKIWADKLVHIGMFAIMVFLWCWGWLRYYRKKEITGKVFIIVAVLSALYGIGMEFVQEYCVSNRSFDVKDMVADSIGAFIGYLYSYQRFIKK